MRFSLLLLLLLPAGGSACAQNIRPLSEPATVSIGVLSLFHPRTLILTSRDPLTLALDSQTFNLAPNHPATLLYRAGGISIETEDEPVLSGSVLRLPVSSFTLTVPGKLSRPYRGALTISTSPNELAAVIVMPTEVAVASIVHAEAGPHASLEALKVQAIVSRSYLLAGPSSHLQFDACDTTHCQFLRSPPPARDPASIAARATRNIVIAWHPAPEAQPVIVRAMFSQRCGGHTRSPLADPSTSPQAYPYYSVACEFCLRHPQPWHRPALPSATTNLTEGQRLAFNRIHGWSALPSTNLRLSLLGVEGRGVGHGVGLCQLGAQNMAAHGASYEKIIAHYFPNTTLFTLR